MGYKFSRCGDGSCPCVVECQSSIACKTVTPCCTDLSLGVWTFSSTNCSITISTTTVTTGTPSGTATFTGTSSGGHGIEVDVELISSTVYRVVRARINYSGGDYLQWRCEEVSPGTFRYMISSSCASLVTCNADFSFGGGGATGCESYPIAGFAKPFPATINIDMTGWELTTAFKWNTFVTTKIGDNANPWTDDCGVSQSAGYACKVFTRDYTFDQTPLNGTHSLPVLSTTSTSATYRATFDIYTLLDERLYIYRNFNGFGDCIVSFPPSGQLNNCDWQSCTPYVSGPHAQFQVTVVITNTCGTSTVNISRSLFKTICGPSLVSPEGLLVPFVYPSGLGFTNVTKNLVGDTASFPVIQLSCYDELGHTCTAESTYSGNDEDFDTTQIDVVVSA